mmetsp:Transcript_18544/g.55948  ORF Transcript_18544/g.55948 Transcript_18544/m.55948 type:complete len:1159 (+) Transcript_18544:117-3593(+)
MAAMRSSFDAAEGLAEQARHFGGTSTTEPKVGTSPPRSRRLTSPRAAGISPRGASSFAHRSPRGSPPQGDPASVLGALQRRSGVDTHGVPPARYGGSGSGGSGSSGTAVRGHGAAPEADDDGYVSSMGRRGVVGDSERDLINRINNTSLGSNTATSQAAAMPANTDPPWLAAGTPHPGWDSRARAQGPIPQPLSQVRTEPKVTHTPVPGGAVTEIVEPGRRTVVSSSVVHSTDEDGRPLTSKGSTFSEYIHSEGRSHKVNGVPVSPEVLAVARGEQETGLRRPTGGQYAAHRGTPSGVSSQVSPAGQDARHDPRASSGQWINRDFHPGSVQPGSGETFGRHHYDAYSDPDQQIDGNTSSARPHSGLGDLSADAHALKLHLQQPGQPRDPAVHSPLQSDTAHTYLTTKHDLPGMRQASNQGAPAVVPGVQAPLTPPQTPPRVHHDEKPWPVSTIPASEAGKWAYEKYGRPGEVRTAPPSNAASGTTTAHASTNDISTGPTSGPVSGPTSRGTGTLREKYAALPGAISPRRQAVGSSDASRDLSSAAHMRRPPTAPANAAQMAHRSSEIAAPSPQTTVSSTTPFAQPAMNRTGLESFNNGGGTNRADSIGLRPRMSMPDDGVWVPHYAAGTFGATINDAPRAAPPPSMAASDRRQASPTILEGTDAAGIASSSSASSEPMHSPFEAVAKIPPNEEQQYVQQQQQQQRGQGHVLQDMPSLDQGLHQYENVHPLQPLQEPPVPVPVAGFAQHLPASLRTRTQQQQPQPQLRQQEQPYSELPQSNRTDHTGVPPAMHATAPLPHQAPPASGQQQAWCAADVPQIHSDSPRVSPPITPHGGQFDASMPGQPRQPSLPGQPSPPSPPSPPREPLPPRQPQAPSPPRMPQPPLQRGSPSSNNGPAGPQPGLGVGGGPPTPMGMRSDSVTSSASGFTGFGSAGSVTPASSMGRSHGSGFTPFGKLGMGSALGCHNGFAGGGFGGAGIGGGAGFHGRDFMTPDVSVHSVNSNSPDGLASTPSTGSTATGAYTVQTPGGGDGRPSCRPPFGPSPPGSTGLGVIPSPADSGSIPSAASARGSIGGGGGVGVGTGTGGTGGYTDGVSRHTGSPNGSPPAVARPSPNVGRSCLGMSPRSPGSGADSAQVPFLLRASASGSQKEISFACRLLI